MSGDRSSPFGDMSHLVGSSWNGPCRIAISYEPGLWVTMDNLRSNLIETFGVSGLFHNCELNYQEVALLHVFGQENCSIVHLHAHPYTFPHLPKRHNLN